MHGGVVDDKEVHLSPAVVGRVRHLVEQPGRVFSREQLLDAVGGHDIYVEVRTVDVHIRRLRKALNDHGSQPDLVRTERAARYLLEAKQEGQNYQNEEGDAAEQAEA